MNSKELFLKNNFVQLLQQLSDNEVGLWGVLSPQGMIEHMTDAFGNGWGRIKLKQQTPPVILEKVRNFKALEGAELIQQLIEKAGNRIKIMPGSGVNEQTVKEVVMKTGAKEIHFSATSERVSPMTFRNEAIAAMGEQGGSEFMLRTVDPERVRRMRALAEAKDRA